MLERAEFDGGQMPRVVRVGEPGDARSPMRRRHRDAKVIERSATTQDRLPAGMVCGRDGLVMINEKMDSFAIGHPVPGLAIMHGRRATSQQDCVLEHLDVHMLYVTNL